MDQTFSRQVEGRSKSKSPKIKYLTAIYKLPVVSIMSVNLLDFRKQTKVSVKSVFFRSSFVDNIFHFEFVFFRSSPSLCKPNHLVFTFGRNPFFRRCQPIKWGSVLFYKESQQHPRRARPREKHNCITKLFFPSAIGSFFLLKSTPKVFFS